MIKVQKVVPREGYKLWLRFNDGVEGVADLSDLAGRGVTKNWSDWSIFSSVAITDSGALEWPGEVDACADALYMRVTGKKPEEVFESVTVAPDL